MTVTEPGMAPEKKEGDKPQDYENLILIGIWLAV